MLNRQLYADFKIFLADDILVKVDRMSMATSLEARAPFLDQDVIELAFRMPGRMKLRGNTRKYILKEAMKGILPPSILHRPKEGFSIPVKNWLRRELRPLMQELLCEERVRRRGLFRWPAIETSNLGATWRAAPTTHTSYSPDGLRALGRGVSSTSGFAALPLKRAPGAGPDGEQKRMRPLFGYAVFLCERRCSDPASFSRAELEPGGA